MEWNLWKKRMKWLIVFIIIHYFGVQNVASQSAPAAEVFITPGDSETTILLSDGRKKELIITPEMIVKNSKYSLVVLLCNASYPIEWIYRGHGVTELNHRFFKYFMNNVYRGNRFAGSQNLHNSNSILP